LKGQKTPNLGGFGGKMYTTFTFWGQTNPLTKARKGLSGAQRKAWTFDKKKEMRPLGNTIKRGEVLSKRKKGGEPFSRQWARGSGLVCDYGPTELFIILFNRREKLSFLGD